MARLLNFTSNLQNAYRLLCLQQRVTFLHCVMQVFDLILAVSFAFLRHKISEFDETKASTAAVFTARQSKEKQCKRSCFLFVFFSSTQDVI